MSKSFMPTIKTKKELADLQLKGLKWTGEPCLSGIAILSEKTG